MSATQINMNKVTPKTAAKLIYELTEGKNETEIKDIIKNIALFLSKHNLIKKEAEVIQKFSELYDSKKNIIKAGVTIAQKIDEASKKNIIDHIASLTGGKTVEAEFAVNTDKLGGFSVKLGDKIHDYTIKKNINDLKNTLNK